MNTLFRKTILFALVLALGAAFLPFGRASAAGEQKPLAQQGPVSEKKLERLWARQLRIYERLGRRFDRADDLIVRARELIERAKANGKDVSGVEAALDAFDAALEDARPIYESAEGIVSAHAGFDDDGQVTDALKAQETVEALRGKFKEIKEALDGAARDLREAIREFREANPRPEPTSTGG